MSEVSLPIQTPPQAMQTDAPAGMTCPCAARIADQPAIDLMGVEVHATTQRQCVDTIMAELLADRGACVIAPNLDHLFHCRRDPRNASAVRPRMALPPDPGTRTLMEALPPLRFAVCGRTDAGRCSHPAGRSQNLDRVCSLRMAAQRRAFGFQGGRYGGR